MPTVILYRLASAGFQRVALNTTAVALNSTVRASNVLDISVESADARYRMDGTAPTSTTGVLIQSDTILRFEGYNGTALLKFCAAAAGSVINVQGYNSTRMS